MEKWHTEEPNVMNQPRTRTLWAIYTVAGLYTIGILAGTAVAQKDSSDKGVNKKERVIALGQDEVKQLLLLMDTDKSGKISRQEFMNFMAAEFDRLDTDKSGELDVRELSKSQLRVSPGAIGK
jgi:hypothetical protein